MSTARQPDDPSPARLDLRAHHLLCVLGFRGLGYSPGFVANMRRVVEALERDPLVEAHLGPDVICAACPHLYARESCTRRDGTQRDRAVAAALELEPGAARSWSRWRALIAQRISPQRLAELCRDCSWFPAGYCLAGLAGADRQPARAPQGG